jgi:AcrR family transcriptional regulator
VAREADVGVGTVYLEFPSKDAIVEELSSMRYRAVLTAMREAAASHRSFGDRLVAVLEARTTFFLELAEKGAHACDLVHCMSPAVKAAKARFADEELALLVDLLRAGARAGQLRAPRPDALARTLLRAYMTFSPPFLFGIAKDEVRSSLSAMHELVLSGVLSRTP